MGKTWNEVYNEPGGVTLFINIIRYEHDQSKYDNLVNELMKKGECNKNEALSMVEGYKKWRDDLDQIAEMRREQKRPRCPTCHSANIHKISTLSKAGSVAVWGIFSQKVKKQFHCNNCGYEW